MQRRPLHFSAPRVVRLRPAGPLPRPAACASHRLHGLTRGQLVRQGLPFRFFADDSPRFLACATMSGTECGKVGGVPMPETPYDAPMKLLHRLLRNEALSFIAILLFVAMGFLRVSIGLTIIGGALLGMPDLAQLVLIKRSYPDVPTTWRVIGFYAEAIIYGVCAGMAGYFVGYSTAPTGECPRSCRGAPHPATGGYLASRQRTRATSTELAANGLSHKRGLQRLNLACRPNSAQRSSTLTRGTPKTRVWLNPTPILRPGISRNRAGHELRVGLDDLEVGLCGLVRLRAVLLPVAQRADRNVEALRELRLRQAELPAQPLGGGHAPHLRELSFGQRLGVRVAQRGLVDLLVRHRVELGPVGGLPSASLRGTSVFHVALLFARR